MRYPSSSDLRQADSDPFTGGHTLGRVRFKRREVALQPEYLLHAAAERARQLQGDGRRWRELPGLDPPDRLSRHAGGAGKLLLANAQPGSDRAKLILKGWFVHRRQVKLTY